jgi:hypothetical protein
LSSAHIGGGHLSVQACGGHDPQEVALSATVHERSAQAEASHREIAEILDDEFLTGMRSSPVATDPAVVRRHQVEALVHVADGRRELLEALRLRFQGRLHAASDDLEATEGLRVVEAALALVARPDEEFWGQQRRKLRRLARRRRLRRRSTR